MSLLPAPLAVRRSAPLARVSPLSRLVAGGTWLVAAVLTTDPLVGLRLCLAALLVLVLGSGLPLRPLPRRLAPVLVAALGLGLVAALGSALNADLAQTALVQVGPWRVTGPALASGAGLTLRLVAIALTSLLVFGPSDITGMADALVQQGHLPDRFSYGTLAALGMAPSMASDWVAIGAARRLRGLAPRGPVGRLADALRRLPVLLVAALRRAERLALAMDARGFDSGLPRSRYRTVPFGAWDVVVLVAGPLIALAILLVGRG